MDSITYARFALIFLISAAILLVVRLQPRSSIVFAPFPSRESHGDDISSSPVDKQPCKIIPEESDADEVTERNKAYFEYLKTVERFSGQEKRKKLPELIGIGTEKCGTEAVRQIIGRNPMVVASNPSELHFFTRYPSSGAEKYLDMMPEVKDYQKVMEKTPAYLWGRSSPQRMHDTVPDAKLFLVLCDPVERTISDFEQEKRQHRLKNTTKYDTTMIRGIKQIEGFLRRFHVSGPSLAHIVLSINEMNVFTHLLAGGMYYFHLMRWFRVYDRSQILIIDFDDVMYRPWEVAKEMQDFIGIPRLVIREDFAMNPETGFFGVSTPTVVDVNGTKTVLRGEVKCRRSKQKSRTRNGAWDQKPKESTLDMVRNFYSEYNEKLFELLGRRFNWQ